MIRAPCAPPSAETLYRACVLPPCSCGSSALSPSPRLCTRADPRDGLPGCVRSPVRRHTRVRAGARHRPLRGAVRARRSNARRSYGFCRSMEEAMSRFLIMDCVSMCVSATAACGSDPVSDPRVLGEPCSDDNACEAGLVCRPPLTAGGSAQCSASCSTDAECDLVPGLRGRCDSGGNCYLECDTAGECTTFSHCGTTTCYPN